ncbi:EF-hand domain-containing protein [Vreelandella titanicae]|uniref:EF-hand domain-containing protein n=1 Tax=Vreelandella titanicae TaxID=664683 RepID=UPI000347BE14|nr:EF-hand domain-containing protein [Halomonas titanicae]
MAQNYKTGLIITGDASGGIRAIKATDDELGKLNKGFDRGSRRSKQFNQNVNATSQGLTVLKRAAAPLAGAIAGMFAANTIQNQVDWGDQLQKTNLRIGASTEALSQYNYVAKLSGVEFGQLTTAWQRQTRRIAEAAAGTGVASEALDRLGLSAQALNQLAPEEQFERIATAMQNVESSSERVALAQKLWDSEGVKLVQIVNQGTDAIAAMRAEANALGLTISQDTANAMATYNDEVDRLKFAAQGLSQTLAADLVPSMTAGLQATSAFIQEIGGAEIILNTTKDAATLLAAIMAGRYAAAFASAAKGIATNTAATIAQAQADVAATSAARAKTAEALRVAASEKAAAARAYENSRAIAAASSNTALRTKAITQMAAANQRAIAAEAAHTAAVNANTTAMARGTVAAQAMAGATRASAGALALVGGPGGAAVVAVGALYYFREELGFVDAAAQNATNALDANSDAIRDGTTAALDATYDNLVNSLEAVSLQAQEAMAQLTELEARQAFYENSHKGMADSVAGAVGDQAQALAGLWERQVQLQTAIRENRAAREEATSADREGARALEDIVVTADATSKSTAKAAEETTTLANSYENLLDRIQPNRRAARQYAQDVGVLNLALATGRMNTVQYMQAMGLLQESFQAAQRETDKTAQASEDASQRIANSFTSWGTIADNTLRSVDDSGRDAWLGLVDGSTSALDTVENAFEQTFANIAHMLTTQKLTFEVAGMMGLDTSGMSGGGAGGFDLSSMSSLKNGWSALKGGVSNIAWTGAGSSYGGTGWANAATQGTGATGFMGGSTANFSGMTGLASAGAGFAGSYAGRSVFGEGRDNDILETAGTLVGAYFGGPLGAAAGSFIGSALASLDKETKFSGRFGTTGTNDPSQYARSGKDGVFEHQDDGENFYGQSALGYTGFLDRGTKRLQRAGMGEDKGWAEELTDAAVVRDTLAASLARTTDELEAMQAAVQGLESSSSTAGELIEFALNERPRAALEALSGQFGEFVRGLEGDFESVVQQAQVAQQAHALLSDGMERLNLQFDATAAGAYESASGLAQYVGGVENMAAINDAYYNAAFSESERLSNSHQDLLQSFSAITDEAPRTVAELRAIVEAQQLNGEASQQLAYDLMALAPALKETNAAVRQAIEQQYQDVLGRAPDASGLDYWFDVVASGSLTLEDALSSIASSAEAAEYASNGAASGIDNMSEALRAREQLEKQLLQVQGNTDALRQLELDRLSELENAEIDNLTALQGRLWAIEDEQAAQQNAERAQQERIRGIEQESQAWARARNEMAGFGNSIDSWLAQHDATEQGMGTPRERLEASDADFWAQYEKALQGDRNAQQGITQYADRYIANLQEMYASSDPAVNGIAEIRDAMERLPELLTPEQFLADEFRGIVGEQTAQLGVMLDLNRDGVVSAIERSITSGWNNIDALKTTLYQEMQQLGAQSLTEQQVRAALAPHATDAEISRLIQRVDHNGDGIISQEEITGSRIAGLSMGIVSALESEFSGIDVDASGLIDYDEFRDAFAGMATDSSLEKLFQLIDKNGDGQISYLESIAASSLTLAEIGLGRQSGDTDDVLGGNPSDIDDIINKNPVSDPVANKIDAAYHDVMGQGAKGFQLTSWSMWLAEKESRAGNLHQAVAWANLPAGGEEWLKERGLYGDGTVPKFANGGVFTNSIVSAPTLFNMGLMGEEDPEAIVPLSRGAGGRLGIDATGLMRLPDGPMQLPIPEMPPLPQFPALGSADVLQVLNDVKRELMETRKESKSLQAENARLLEALGGAIEKHGNRSHRQRENQIDELQAINRNSKTRSKTP